MSNMTNVRLKLSHITSIILITLLSSSISVFADARTTPVEVKNPVSLDSNGNTVSAQQIGPWSVNVLGTSSVNVSNTPSVLISGTPSVNVSNTPSVNVNNSPTVKIDAASNVVRTNTASNLIQLWTTLQSLANGAVATSSVFDTTGYKEMRVMIRSSSSSSSLYVSVDLFAFNNSWTIGTANFAAPTHPPTEQGNFVQESRLCTFTLPVYGNNYRIKVINSTGGPVDIYTQSLVYLVN